MSNFWRLAESTAGIVWKIMLKRVSLLSEIEWCSLKAISRSAKLRSVEPSTRAIQASTLNTGTPAPGDPFTFLGAQTQNFGAIKAQEKIVITVMDNGNAGCTSKQSKQSVLETTVRLAPLEDEPFLLFYQDGMDICERCKDAGTCSMYCPSWVPKVYSFESTTLNFNQSFSVQIRDFDTLT